MKSINDFLVDSINESSYYRAKSGNVIEVELENDGHFFWHTPDDDDWDKFKDMKDWEVKTDEMPERFFVKIGKK